MSIKHGIVLPDLHAPKHDRASLAAVESYAAAQDLDYFFQLGDFLNFDQISRHTKNDLVAQTTVTIEEEYAVGNLILDRWDSILAPKTDKRMIQGNHDFRPIAFAKEHPQIRGTLADVSLSLGLKDRGWKWVPQWSRGSVTTVGRMTFLHGYSVAKNHAKIMYDAYGGNVFYGHTHDTVSHSPVMFGTDNTPVAQSCGHLMLPDPDYMRGNPSRWQQAFLEFWVRPDGFFHYDIIRLFNHAFVRNGKLYDGRAILRGKR